MTRKLPLILGSALIAACGGEPAQQAQSPAPRSEAPAAPAAHASTANLSPEERRDFYHLPEGGELMPLAVLRALQSPTTFGPFMDNLERFRFIPDPDDPDGLPIGLSATLVGEQRSDPRMVYINCAACHMAEIRYKGKSLYVEGAPAMFDTAGFVNEMLTGLETTVTDPTKLSAFLSRLAQEQGQTDLAAAYPDLGLSKDNAQQELPDKVAKFLAERKAKAEETKLRIASASDAVDLIREKITYLHRLNGLKTPTWSGYGRIDAFTAVRNLLFGEPYLVEVDAPVSLPPIYGVSRYTFFHYDNNVNSIIQRNIGEDLGMGAVADLSTGHSTVELRHLMRLESIVAKLPIPKWPTDMLGELDAAKVAAGKPIYEARCASCHEGNADGSFPDRTYPLDQIGTDPNRAHNFAAMMGDRSFKDRLSEAIAQVQKNAMEAENITPEEIAAFDRQPVEWRAPDAYASRPLAGVWATAPYLHNGSVPSLHDLLLPEDQRPKQFQMGGREYDPVNVGFLTDGSDGGKFHFDTALTGNHNTGHSYGTDLSEPDRMALIEYLKSL